MVLLASGLTNRQIGDQLVISPPPPSGTWSTSSTSSAFIREASWPHGSSNIGSVTGLNTHPPVQGLVGRARAAPSSCSGHVFTPRRLQSGRGISRLTAFVFYTAAVCRRIGTAARLGLDAASTRAGSSSCFSPRGLRRACCPRCTANHCPSTGAFPHCAPGRPGRAVHLPERWRQPAGCVIVLVGVLGLGARLLAWLPLPIALGMLWWQHPANMRDLVAATIDDGLRGGRHGRRLPGRARWLGWRSGAPMGLAALAGRGRDCVRTAGDAAGGGLDTAHALMSGPQFTAFVAVSLPLMQVLAVGSATCKGWASWKAQGYPCPPTRRTLVVGLQSVVNAAFGGHQAIVGRNCCCNSGLARSWPARRGGTGASRLPTASDTCLAACWRTDRLAAAADSLGVCRGVGRPCPVAPVSGCPGESDGRETALRRERRVCRCCHRRSR